MQSCNDLELCPQDSSVEGTRAVILMPSPTSYTELPMLPLHVLWKLPSDSLVAHFESKTRNRKSLIARLLYVFGRHESTALPLYRTTVLPADMPAEKEL